MSLGMMAHFSAKKKKQRTIKDLVTNSKENLGILRTDETPF